MENKIDNEINTKLIDLIFGPKLPIDYFSYEKLEQLYQNKALTAITLKIIIKKLLIKTPLEQEKNNFQLLSELFKIDFDSQDCANKMKLLSNIACDYYKNKENFRLPSDLIEIYNTEIPIHIFLKALVNIPNLKEFLDTIKYIEQNTEIEISDESCNFLRRYVTFFSDNTDIVAIKEFLTQSLAQKEDSKIFIKNSIYINMLFQENQRHYAKLWPEISSLFDLEECLDFTRYAFFVGAFQLSQQIISTISSRATEDSSLSSRATEDSSLSFNDIVTVLFEIFANNKSPTNSHACEKALMQIIRWENFLNLDNIIATSDDQEEIESNIGFFKSASLIAFNKIIEYDFSNAAILFLEEAAKKIDSENLLKIMGKPTDWLFVDKFARHPNNAHFIFELLHHNKNEQLRLLFNHLFESDYKFVEKVVPYIIEFLVLEPSLPKSIQAVIVEPSLEFPVLEKLHAVIVHSADLLTASFFTNYFKQYPESKKTLQEYPFLLERFYNSYKKRMSAHQSETDNNAESEEDLAHLEVIFDRNLSTLIDLTLSSEQISSLANRRIAASYINGFQERFFSYLGQQSNKLGQGLRVFQNWLGPKSSLYRDYPFLYSDYEEPVFLEKYQRYEKQLSSKRGGRALLIFSQEKVSQTHTRSYSSDKTSSASCIV